MPFKKEKAIGIFITMNRKKKLSIRIKIIVATLTAVFSLFSAFSATYAWFVANQSVSATGMSVTIKAPEGIQFEFYYLDYFNLGASATKDGNFDTVANAYAGYELAAANPVFKKINYDESGDVIDDAVHGGDPTGINHLWPAHRLTYAIVITAGTLNSFSLDSWGEIRSASVLTRINDADVQVSLSWAINIYGGAYYIASTAEVLDDISTGFSSYNSDLNNSTLTDKFLYSQTNIAPETKPVINICDSISGASGDNKRVVLYFSIEFSDDSSTYYTYDSPYYVKDTLGNSNCYEKLSLTGLSFKLL